MSADARIVITAIEGEFRRYRELAEGAAAQLADDELHLRHGDGNSVATLLQHVGGNLRSRFTDFLSSDGEKPWRDREEEFHDQGTSREDLFATWNGGWSVLVQTLSYLGDADLDRRVTIRNAGLSVAEALARSLAHTSYHVGQIVLLARGVRQGEWRFLSIPPASRSK